MNHTQRIDELKTEYAQLHETVLRLFDSGAADGDPLIASLQRRENAINIMLIRFTHTNAETY